MNQPLQESKTNAPEGNGITNSEEGKIPFWRVMMSVIQASFGVQNNNNRERDFTQGKFLPFVVAALLFTAVFVVTLLMIVRTVLSGT